MWVGLVALVWFVGMRFVNGELQSLSDLVEWVRSGPWMVVAAGALVLLGVIALVGLIGYWLFRSREV